MYIMPFLFPCQKYLPARSRRKTSIHDIIINTVFHVYVSVKVGMLTCSFVLNTKNCNNQ